MGNLSGSEPGYNDFNLVPEPVRKPGTQLYLEPVRFRREQYGGTWKVLDGGEDEAPDRYMESGQHSEATGPSGTITCSRRS